MVVLSSARKLSAEMGLQIHQNPNAIQEMRRLYLSGKKPSEILIYMEENRLLDPMIKPIAGDLFYEAFHIRPGLAIAVRGWRIELSDKEVDDFLIPEIDRNLDKWVKQDFQCE